MVAQVEVGLGIFGRVARRYWRIADAMRLMEE
jgi:hypothetical protein